MPKSTAKRNKIDAVIANAREHPRALRHIPNYPLARAERSSGKAEIRLASCRTFLLPRIRGTRISSVAARLANVPRWNFSEQLGELEIRRC